MPVVDFALYKVRRDQSRLPAYMQSGLVSFARLGEFKGGPDLWAERHSPYASRNAAIEATCPPVNPPCK